MSNQGLSQRLKPGSHEATAQRRRSRTRSVSAKRRNVVFRAMDGRQLHVAKGDDRYVIACGAKYTYVVVYRGRGHWNVEVIEDGGIGDMYLWTCPTWAAAQSNRRGGRRTERTERTVLHGALVLKEAHEEPAPNVDLLAP
jgi:hypothetical protein